MSARTTIEVWPSTLSPGNLMMARLEASVSTMAVGILSDIIAAGKVKYTSAVVESTRIANPRQLLSSVALSDKERKGS